METVVKFDGVCFGYGDVAVLDHVSLCVNKGDFIALIGSNGTGKSTMMKLLLGERLPDAGEIRLFGKRPDEFRAWPRVGYVPQNGIAAQNRFPATAMEIVRAGLYSRIGAFRMASGAHTRMAQEAIDLVGMRGYEKRLISEMSGGQQQRMMLARVLVSQPELLLMDEPTSGVDNESARGIYEVLLRLNRERNMTLMMVTHDVAKAAEYVGRILCLEEGSVVELAREELKSELRHKHKHPGRTEGADEEGQHGHI